MIRKPATACAATMPALFADHATAQAVGLERAELVSRLEEGYAETRRPLGVACNKHSTNREIGTTLKTRRLDRARKAENRPTMRSQ